MTELHRLLADLIGIPSPNPPGDAREIATFIGDWLRPTGAEVKLLAPPEKPDAQSVVATLGSGEAPVIILHAHLDTVPTGETEAMAWSHDPFDAVVEEGRMYGKGSVDDKAPLSAMMLAFKKCALRGDLPGTLVLAAVAEEETGGQLGTRWLADSGHLPHADFIVVGEQTHNQVALAHKGVMRATVTTRGLSAHATDPNRGVNAITAMAKIILALAQYHQQLSSRSHSLAGVATCNVGTVAGGSTANAVPDTCVVRIDRRMIPREDPKLVEEELRQVIDEVHVAPAEAAIDGFQSSSWFESSLDTDLGRSFLASVRRVSGNDGEPIGYLPGSDAKHLTKLMRGDMLVFGPGSYEVAHAPDEYVELAALDECEAILSDFLRHIEVGGN